MKPKSRITLINNQSIDVMESLDEILNALSLGGSYMVLNLPTDDLLKQSERVIVSCSSIVTVYRYD